jgi:hypothetical protein
VFKSFRNTQLRRAEASNSLVRDAKPIRKFRDGLGVGTSFTLGQSMSELPMVGELGVSWVRDGVYWSALEQTPGVYLNFPEAFAQRLTYYKSHDIGLVFMLAYANPKAYPITSTAPDAPFDKMGFARYAVHVARLLKTAGVRFVLEVWNEPHLFHIGPHFGGAWNGTPPAAWLQHYVGMVRETVAAVKSLDSSIRLLSNDDMWVLHYRFLEAGLPTDLDGFAFHPYVRHEPERAAVSDSSEWVKPFTVVDPDGSFSSAVHRLRQRGLERLGHVPEMWITEWGWKIAAAGSTDGVTEAEVASYLPRAYILAEAAGVEATCWFSLQDRADGRWGLTTNTGEKRQSFRAFQVLRTELGEWSLREQIVGAQSPTRGIQAFQFFLAGAPPKIVVWTLDPTPTSRLHLDGELLGAAVRDVFGKNVEPHVDKSGLPYVRLSESPLYVQLARSSLSEVTR